MMAAPVYLGDEVSAAGWRLAGAHTLTPEAAGAAQALARALEQAPLVLVSTAVAAQLAPGVLASALARLSPLVMLVPDLDGQFPLPDLAAQLRAQLGLEA
jgi:vacuolar-type H+-ATPase subunit F/Vma7